MRGKVRPMCMKTGNRSFLLLIAILSFMAIALSLWSGGTPTMQAQGDDSQWPMFRYDSMHTGRSPHTGPDNPATKWSFETEDSIASSPAIGADGTIYIGSHDNKLYAINPDSTEKWSYATKGEVTSSPTIGADGIIYVGSNDKRLYAVANASTLPASAVQQESAESDEGAGTNVALLIIIPVVIVAAILLFFIFRRGRRTSGTS